MCFKYVDKSDRVYFKHGRMQFPLSGHFCICIRISEYAVIHSLFMSRVERGRFVRVLDSRMGVFVCLNMFVCGHRPIITTSSLECNSHSVSLHASIPSSLCLTLPIKILSVDAVRSGRIQSQSESDYVTDNISEPPSNNSLTCSFLRFALFLSLASSLISISSSASFSSNSSTNSSSDSSPLSILVSFYGCGNIVATWLLIQYQ